MALTGIRKTINDVDTQLSQLFEKRFECSQAVSDVKKTTQAPTNVPEREEEIIHMRQQEVSKPYRPYYRTFLQELMALSRSYQYGQATHEQAMLQPYLEDHDLEETLEISFDRCDHLFVLLSVAHALEITLEAIDTEQEADRFRLLISAKNIDNLRQFVTQVYLETSHCKIQ